MGEVLRSKSIKDIFMKMDYGKKKDRLDLAQEWVKKNKPLGAWINGAFISDKNAKFNPVKTCDGQSIADVIDSVGLVDTAFDAATKAHTVWGEATSGLRSDLLQGIANTLTTKKEIFKQLTDYTLQYFDFELFVDYFDYYSGWAFLVSEDLRHWKSLGTILIILSKDSTLSALSMIVAPALAAGCTVVIKPSSKAPFCSLLLAEIISSCGLPQGAVNVLPGSKNVSSSLLKKTFSKVFFCGNWTIARSIKQDSFDKPLNFLQPGCTAAIILDINNIGLVLDKIFEETFDVTNGNPWSISTIIVKESVYDKFVKLISELINNFTDHEIHTKFKDPILLEKIQEVKKIAIKNGCKILETPTQNNKIWSPTVVFDLQAQEYDVNTPVISVLRCRTATEGIALLNHSFYGLAASVWSDKAAQALEVALSLDVGTLWINCHGLSSASVPIEARKLSGKGAYGGREGLLRCMYRNTEGDKSGLSPKESNIISSDYLDRMMMHKFVRKAHDAFVKWIKETNKKKYILEVSQSLAKTNEYMPYVNIVKYWALYSGKITLPVETMVNKSVSVTQKKLPLGVIVISMLGQSGVIKNLISLASAAVALGNAVIVVTEQENATFLQPVISYFISSLPTGVFLTINGSRAIQALASDPLVQTLWLSSDTTISLEAMAGLENVAAVNLKPIWVTPTLVPKCRNLFSHKALQTKVLWLPCVDSSL